MLYRPTEDGNGTMRTISELSVNKNLVNKVLSAHEITVFGTTCCKSVGFITVVTTL